MTKPVRTLVTTIVVNLGVALTFAALTLAFAGPLLDYRAAREPGQARIHLMAELLSRPLQTAIIAVLCLFTLRAVARGSARAYGRIRIFSFLGLIGGGWVLISGQYPAWLWPVEILQTLTAVALMVIANSRAVRAEFSSASCAPRALRSA
jgi:Na+-driven multidrug efflux pump